MSIESFHDPVPTESTEIEVKKVAKKKRVAIVDTREAIEDQARDMAEEKLTASKESLKGIKGLFSKIWKHNLFNEYYRQKEIALAKNEIKESGNLYIGENANQQAHDTAMNSVVDRFIQEYEEAIHTEAGEERKIVGNESAEDQHLNIAVRALVREFASGRIDEECFKEERNRIIADATGFSAEELKNEVNSTDNLLEIARQSKMAVSHGASLDEIDTEIEVVIGKAKVGVRTESKYNTVDRIASKIQSTKVGKYLNETTVASGVAIAYGITVGLSQRLARSKALAWGTFGASVIVGGAIAGAKESVKVEDERRQHSRERAKGKEMTEDMSRRVEMEQIIYKTTLASSLIESLKNTSKKIHSPEDFFGAMTTLAETEARIKMSDTEKVDLIGYSNFKSVEEERLALDIARAEAKVKLRTLIDNGVIEIPGGKSFDEFYASAVNIQKSNLREGQEGMETKDRLFKKMKRKKVAGAAFKAVTTGLVVGGVAQEAAAFLNDSKEGLVEHIFGGDKGSATKSVTALEGIRRWMNGEKVLERAMHHAILSNGVAVNLPDGIEIVPNPRSSGEFLFTKDGEVISDKIQFNAGKLTPASEEILKQHEVTINTTATHITKQEEVLSGPKDIVNKHPELFHKIQRKLWYENDTPKSDLNELKTHFGGAAGKGVDSSGNYVMSVSKMTSNGSFHKGFSVDVHKALGEGKLKMLLSLSKDTQSHVVEVPIDKNGQIVLDPKSDIAKMFFKNEGGQLKFIGKFMEIGQSVGKAKDGTEQFNLLGTAIGAGQESIKTIKDVIVSTPVTSIEVKDELPYVESPYFIPVVGRKPLEPMESKKLTDNTREYYYSNDENDFGLLDRKKYRERMSKKILEDKNIDLSKDDSEVITEYLENQDPAYLAELNKLIAGTETIGKEIETVITVPAYQEGKNFEHTIRSYAKLNNRNKFELVILENHPTGVSRDNTMEVINRMKLEFPDLNLVHLYKVFDEKPAIGEVRKYLVDSVLLRKSKSGIKKSLVVVSNDADLEDISENYADKISTTFKDNPNVDAVGAKWDFPKESFKQFPLLHVSQRLWHYLDIAFRNYYLKSPELIGRNSAFRSGTYAAIGGYNKDSKLAEDLEIGWLIKEARGYDSSRISYVNSAWLVSNPRRAVVKILSGGKLIEQYGDFHVNEDVRKAPLDKLLENKHELKEEDFAVQVQSIYDHYARWKKSSGGWVEDKYVDKSFNRAMRFLGVQFKIEKGKIVIMDISRMTEGLKKYESKIV